MTLLIIIAYLLVGAVLTVAIQHDKALQSGQEAMYVVTFWPVFLIAALLGMLFDSIFKKK